MLKSSGSSFTKFVRDEFTTLAEAEERVFSTAVNMTYTFPAFTLGGVAGLGALEGRYGFGDAASKARGITLEVFATDESASVQVRERVRRAGRVLRRRQATLYKMAERVLAAHGSVKDVSYVLPNRHYLAVDMPAFDPVDGKQCVTLAVMGVVATADVMQGRVCAGGSAEVSAGLGVRGDRRMTSCSGSISATVTRAS